MLRGTGACARWIARLRRHDPLEGLGARMALDACIECGHEIPAHGKFCPRCGAKVPSGFYFAVGLFVTILAAFFLLYTLFSRGETQPREPPQPTGKINNDVGPGSQFASDHPGLLPNVAALISTRGHTCPFVVNLWDEGPTPSGQRLEALCGPDKQHADPDLHYAVYPERGEVNVCARWEVFGPDCK